MPDGKVGVQVKYKGIKSIEDVHIVPDEYEALLDHTWIQHLKVSFQKIYEEAKTSIDNVEIRRISSIEDVTVKLPEIFNEKIGCVPNFEMVLQLQKKAKSVFHKERNFPYALRERVEKELNDLEANGIITKVAMSDWGSPLVVIPKSDRGVQLCVDYKIGVNERLVSANYPIRKINKILNSLRGPRYFCQLDQYKAYLIYALMRKSVKFRPFQLIGVHIEWIVVRN